MKEIKCILKGRVQGVFLRDFVRSTANKLGVTGTVENMANGTVEVFAQGHVNALEDFIRQLHIGSEHSQVKEVVVDRREIHDPIKGFTIL